MRLNACCRCGAAVVVATAGFLTGHAAVPMATPESVGFSSAGLKNFEQQMHALVDEQQLAGVTTLVSRRGKVVAFNALWLSGCRDENAAGQGHHLSHRVDDQADCRCRDDDVVRRRQVDARRSGCQAHSAVQGSEGGDRTTGRSRSRIR